MPIAAKPWATGTSTAGSGRAGRCRGARRGAASSRAIISSVTPVASASGGSAAGRDLRGGYGAHSVTVHRPRPIAAISSPTPAQASGRRPEARNAAQLARPASAAAACPKISCGGRPPAARDPRRPPRASQECSMKPPRPAVTSQLTRVARRMMC